MSLLTAHHPVLDNLSTELAESGTWARWSAADARLATYPSLQAALAAGRRREAPAYLSIAALAARGSRRGADEDTAAMAVVVMLQDAIARVARDLRDCCELDDVLAAVWEEVKRSAPNLEHHAARFLIKRAKDRCLSAPRDGYLGPVRNGVRVHSLEEMRAGPLTYNSREDSRRGFAPAPGGSSGRALMELMAPVDDPCSDLIDLLDWARGTGVLGQAEVDLVLELMAAERAATGREDAYRALGERHGVALRTMRRRRDAVVDKLRNAAGQYLADVS